MPKEICGLDGEIGQAADNSVDSPASRTYVNAFDGLRDDLTGILATMKPEEQDRFYMEELRHFATYMRRRVAELAEQFKTRNGRPSRQHICCLDDPFNYEM
jgi:hypothetical protein